MKICSICESNAAIMGCDCIQCASKERRNWCSDECFFADPHVDLPVEKAEERKRLSLKLPKLKGSESPGTSKGKRSSRSNRDSTTFKRLSVAFKPPKLLIDRLIPLSYDLPQSKMGTWIQQVEGEMFNMNVDVKTFNDRVELKFSKVGKADKVDSFKMLFRRGREYYAFVPTVKRLSNTDGGTVSCLLSFGVMSDSEDGIKMRDPETNLLYSRWKGFVRIKLWRGDATEEMRSIMNESQ